MATRSTEQKLDLFTRCFQGRQDAYGTYVPATGRVWCVRQPVTRRVLLDHLRGRKPYGVFLLVDDRVSAAAIDFDHDDLNPVIACVDQARSYGLTLYIERSKAKGHHAWLFLKHPTPAAKPRAVLEMILSDTDLSGTEVFPKQSHLDPCRQALGNFINAPLFGKLVAEGRTVFLDRAKGWQPHDDQWELLTQFDRACEQHLDELIEINELLVSRPNKPPVQPDGVSINVLSSYGLPPCAISMLEGVAENQRVCAFRLAVHLHRLGIPQDLAIAMLRAWALRNRPSGGKGVINDSEIEEQVRHGYRGYRGYGCEDPIVASHCAEQCPVRAANLNRPA